MERLVQKGIFGAAMGAFLSAATLYAPPASLPGAGAGATPTPGGGQSAQGPSASGGGSSAMPGIEDLSMRSEFRLDSARNLEMPNQPDGELSARSKVPPVDHKEAGRKLARSVEKVEKSRLVPAPSGKTYPAPAETDAEVEVDMAKILSGGAQAVASSGSGK